VLGFDPGAIIDRLTYNGLAHLSQRQLAERARMTQPGVARFEAGGTTPTIPVLERLATALGLRLTIAFGPDERQSA
jgi:HTH-type transcriptional regulator/antitoxin HipB